MKVFSLLSFCALQAANSPMFVAAQLGGTNDVAQQQLDPPSVIEDGPLEVIASVSFSVVIDGGIENNISWEEYESELVWAVDILALEALAVMQSNWGRSLGSGNTDANQEDTSASSPEVSSRRQLQTRVDIPTSLGRLPAESQEPCPAEVGDVELDRCEVIFAAIRLMVDTDQGDDPIQMEESFKVIFSAAIEYGRLQVILEESFPDLFVRVFSKRDVEPTSTSSPKPEEPATGGYFQDVPFQTDPSPTPKTESESSDGLSLGSLLAILTGVCVLFMCAAVSAFYLGHKRISTLFSVNKEVPEIEQQETDLIENFSEAGLEWGSPEVLKESQQADPIFDAKKNVPKFSIKEPPKKNVNVAGLYTLPSSLQLPEQSPISAISGPLSNVSSTGSGGSAETSVFMSDMSVFDSSPTANTPSPSNLAVNLDGLEAAIVEGDWDTVAAAANAITETSDQTTEADLSLVSLEWSYRDKSWHNALDATRAAELDDLIEHGDWSGIMEAAARYGSKKLDEEA
jgi:hypothetical protein